MPETPTPPAAESFDDVCMRLDRAVTTFRRSVAGYRALQIGYEGVCKPRKNGEEPQVRSVPIFEFTSTYDGNDSTRCAVDLRKMSAESAKSILAPCINLTVAEAKAALRQMQDDVAILLEHLEGDRT